MFLYFIWYFCVISILAAECPSPPPYIGPGPINLTPPPFTGMCPLLGFTYPDNQCLNWDIASMIVLRENQQSFFLLDEIKGFLKDITRDCYSSTRFMHYEPGTIQKSKDCEYFNTNSKNFDHEIIYNMDLEDMWVGNTTHPIISMFEKHYECNKNRNTDTGGVLYFFTDLKCNADCDEMTGEIYDLVQHQKTIVDELRAIGYILAFVYFDTGNDTDDASDCNIKTILSYCTQYEDVIVAGTSVAALGAYVAQLRPCAPAPKKAKKKLDWPVLLIPLYFCVLLFIVSLGFYFYHKRYRRNLQKKLSRREPFEQMNNMFKHLVHFSPKLAELVKVADKMRRSSVEIDPSMLYVESSVGTGAFGVVNRGVLMQLPSTSAPSSPSTLSISSFFSNCTTGYDVAVKTLRETATESDRLEFFSEMRILKKLGSHPHIVFLVGTISDIRQPKLVTEYCIHGDMLQYLRAHNNSHHECSLGSTCISFTDLLSFSLQVSLAMEHVSSLHIVHRDLAARNILLTSNMVVKVADFGIAKVVKHGKTLPITERIAPKWTALEALQHGKFTEKSDVWSFGVVLFEFFSLGLAPFSTVQPDGVVAALLRGHRLSLPEDVPTDIKQVAESCCMRDVGDRPPFSRITATLSRLLQDHDEDRGYVLLSNRRSTVTSIDSSCIVRSRHGTVEGENTTAATVHLDQSDGLTEEGRKLLASRRHTVANLRIISIHDHLRISQSTRRNTVGDDDASDSRENSSTLSVSPW